MLRSLGPAEAQAACAPESEIPAIFAARHRFSPDQVAGLFQISDATPRARHCCNSDVFGGYLKSVKGIVFIGNFLV